MSIIIITTTMIKMMIIIIIIRLWCTILLISTKKRHRSISKSSTHDLVLCQAIPSIPPSSPWSTRRKGQTEPHGQKSTPSNPSRRDGKKRKKPGRTRTRRRKKRPKKERLPKPGSTTKWMGGRTGAAFHGMP